MPKFIPLPPRTLQPHDGLAAARDLFEALKTRRSIREFSDHPVPQELIEQLVATAATAPSGANRQPWHFVCVANAEKKRAIREAAEAEEQAFYESKAPQEWLDALAHLGTDADKRYLEVAPWLVAVFRQTHDDAGSKNYYTQESVGIAVGMFVTAAHLAGLCTLTHTPAPMKFLAKILGRPSNEKPYVLMPVGYPAENCQVPEFALRKKPMDQIMTVFA